MKLYADVTRIRSRQVGADLLVLVWCYLSVRVGSFTYDSLNALGDPARRISASAAGLESDSRGISRSLPRFLDGAPNKLGETAGSLRAAGDDNAQAIHDLGLALGWGITILMIVSVMGWYLSRRISWIREATAVHRMANEPGLDEILARRAVVNQPLHRLLPPAGRAGKQGNEADSPGLDIKALADLERERLGLRFHP